MAGRLLWERVCVCVGVCRIKGEHEMKYVTFDSECSFSHGSRLLKYRKEERNAEKSQRFSKVKFKGYEMSKG